MSINPAQPETATLCPAWCEDHKDCGDLDGRHRSHTQRFECLDSTTIDKSFVEISVEQYTSLNDDGVWESNPATILLNLTRLGGGDLTPFEARLQARRLLVAADIAEGVALAW